MAKINKSKSKAASYRQKTTPYAKECHSKKKLEKPSEKKSEWEGIFCSICLEFPHNAVLLLCSSYDKGCRPYMCATSRRFSNCLAQFKKANTKVTTTVQQSNWTVVETDTVELLCPLCRGQVKGWTVVEPARKHFNAKKRGCLQDKCSFAGTYKQLKRHVKAEHPLARPRDVDPVLEQKWKVLELQRERRDVIGTIISSTPDAVVLGDYVIEPGGHVDDFVDYESESDDSIGGGFHRLERFDRTVLLPGRQYGLLVRRRQGRLRDYRSRSPRASYLL